jgi:hypothetical protein
MEIRRISPYLIKTNNAVNGDFLVYNASNAAVEFKSVDVISSGVTIADAAALAIALG